MSKASVICIDLDGVLVDFHTPLVRLFGDDPERYSESQWAEVAEWGLSIPKDHFWERVRSQGIQWWLNLPKLPWCDELWAAALETQATCLVLTTPGPFPESVAGKWLWVEKHLKTKKLLIGQPKDVCSRPGTWLIDDRPAYAPKWEAQGGRLLALKRPWNPEGMSVQSIIQSLRDLKS